MLRALALLLACLGAGAVLAAGEPTAARAEANSCVDCHNALPKDTAIGQRHRDYAGSVHDRNGVRCDACHGGDPAHTDKAAAHVGVLPASNPESRVYYRNVPRTCGGCHRPQYQAFIRSRHYLQLRTTGRGPTCFTCHGSMGTHILAPSQFREACGVCHNDRGGVVPAYAREGEATLLLMEQANTLIAWAREFTAAAKGRGEDVTAAERALAAADKELGVARGAWHTFNMAQVRQHIVGALAAARTAKGSLP